MRRRLLLGLFALVASGAAGSAFASGDKKDAKKKAGGESFLPLKTLTAFTHKGAGRRGVMTVDCGLDVPDAKLRERTELLLPRIRAAFVQSLQIYAGGLPAGYPPNAEFLAKTLQRNADQVIGKPGARVLLGAIILV